LGHKGPHQKRAAQKRASPKRETLKKGAREWSCTPPNRRTTFKDLD